MATIYTPDNLVIEVENTDSVTIASGQNIVKGEVLGKVTLSGEYVSSLSSSTDGSEVPYAIAVDDVDATSLAKTNVGVYIGGEFQIDGLTIGTGHTVDSVKEAFRQVGIYVKQSVKG